MVQAMHDCLYQEPRVAEVLRVEYGFNRIKRHLTINFRARTVEGHEIEGRLLLTKSGFKRQRTADYLPIIEEQARDLYGEDADLSIVHQLAK